MVHPDIDRLVADIREKDLYKIAADMGNVLETVTIPAYPVIADIKDHMMEHGAECHDEWQWSDGFGL